MSTSRDRVYTMAEEPISQRCTKLKGLLNENGRTDERTLQLSNEALLDGFIVLFDECSSEHLQRDKHVAEFVKKCKYSSILNLSSYLRSL